MTAQFYYVLFYSLLATVGLFILYYLYRYFLRDVRNARDIVRYIIVDEHSRDVATGEIFFRFDVPEQLHISFYILDENENVVQILTENEMMSGANSVKLKGASLSNGSYYFRLVSPKQTITRKFEVRNL